MMDWAKESLEALNASRAERTQTEPWVLSQEESDRLIQEHHPDYSGDKSEVRIGPNAGQLKCPKELACLLEADSPLPDDFKPQSDIETDVLIIGGGGAGVTAALGLEGSGLRVHLATKLRVGDANTVMAEGGIQASVGADDSSRRHFADSYVGGHGKNDTGLLRYLVEEGPAGIGWLTALGAQFDRTAEGKFRLKPGGGTSTPRVLACRDYTGLEIMRVLKDAVCQGSTQFLENHAAVELTDDGKGRVTGAVLWNSETKTLTTVSARAVIMATGGCGQLRFQDFPTSNHFGATADGLVLAYRQGCRLAHLESFQYHPTGASFPEALAGQLVTESIRSSGAHLVNAQGKRFINEMGFRDVVAAAIIKEVKDGRGITTPNGRQGVWLDTPMIDHLKGEGTLHKQFPGLIHRFERYGIDPACDPILIYPTLHYQNGGVAIDEACKTCVPGLWAAGEVTGGVHGTNRLMGNSLLDIIVFGRKAAQSVRDNLPERGALTLTRLAGFREERKQHKGISEITAPQLYPAISGWTFSLAGQVPSPEQDSGGSSFASGGGFEPPDPFSGR